MALERVAVRHIAIENGKPWRKIRDLLDATAHPSNFVLVLSGGT